MKDFSDLTKQITLKNVSKTNNVSFIFYNTNICVVMQPGVEYKIQPQSSTEVAYYKLKATKDLHVLFGDKEELPYTTPMVLTKGIILTTYQEMENMWEANGEVPLCLPDKELGFNSVGNRLHLRIPKPEEYEGTTAAEVIVFPMNGNGGGISNTYKNYELDGDGIDVEFAVKITPENLGFYVSVKWEDSRDANVYYFMYGPRLYAGTRLTGI